MLAPISRRDYDNIPSSAREKLEFVWLERVDDAIAVALEGGATPAAPTVGVTTQTEQPAVKARPAHPTPVRRHRFVTNPALRSRPGASC